MVDFRSRVTRERPINDRVPLNEGWYYLLVPGYPSNNWVVITKIDRKYVYARGLFGDYADLQLRKTAFDDIVTAWYDPLAEEPEDLNIYWGDNNLVVFTDHAGVYFLYE